MGTSQRLIPGTFRSAIIQHIKEDQIAVEVYRIQDMLLVDYPECVGKSELVINVGFPMTTIYHGAQPSESVDEWQKSLLHVIKHLRPEHVLHVRSGIPGMLTNAITPEFINSLRGTMNFEMEKESGGITFKR